MIFNEIPFFQSMQVYFLLLMGIILQIRASTLSLGLEEQRSNPTVPFLTIKTLQVVSLPEGKNKNKRPPACRHLLWVFNIMEYTEHLDCIIYSYRGILEISSYIPGGWISLNSN
jgi:hypothetical protein